MDEADEHPLGDQRRLRADHGVEQGQGGSLGVGGRRVVAGDGVVDQPAEQVEVAGRRGVLEAAHPQVAARHPGQHRPGQQVVALHRTAGRDHGQRARRRDPEGVHGLADDVLAQHRADGGQTVPAAGERGPAGALEVQVAQASVGADQLAEQQRPAVAEAGGVAAELVAGVGLRHGVASAGSTVPVSSPTPSAAAQPGRVQAELERERLVEHDAARGSGGVSARQAIASSPSSRAKRPCRVGLTEVTATSTSVRRSAQAIRSRRPADAGAAGW